VSIPDGKRPQASRSVLACLGMLVFLSLPAQGAPAAPTVVGTFSNVRTTAEHAYGYYLQLWSEDGKLIGLLSVMNGLAGDAPAGMLEQVEWNPRTGKLRFRAKLTLGLAYLGPNKQRPSEDLFVFSGTLSGQAVSGVMRQFDKLRPSAPPVVERVRLKKRDGDEILHPRSYEEWQQIADRILKARGPRW
jgi:hypothetical protein